MTGEFMTYILAIFRSRSQAMDCNIRLKTFLIPSELISTPKEANVGCGLSLKIPHDYAEKAKRIISKSNYPAFYGYFLMQYAYGRLRIGRWG